MKKKVWLYLLTLSIFVLVLFLVFLGGLVLNTVYDSGITQMGEMRNVNLHFNNNLVYNEAQPVIKGSISYFFDDIGCQREESMGVVVQASIDGEPIFSRVANRGGFGGYYNKDSGREFYTREIWGYDIVVNDLVSGKHTVCTEFATTGSSVDEEWKYVNVGFINDKVAYVKRDDWNGYYFDFMMGLVNKTSLVNANNCVYRYDIYTQRRVYSNCNKEDSGRVYDVYMCNVPNVVEDFFMVKPSGYIYKENCVDIFVIKQSDIEKIKNNDLLQAELQVILGNIEDLNVTLQEKIAIAKALQLTVDEQAAFIQSLDLKIVEQADIIKQLSDITKEQADIVVALDLKVDEQVIMIGSLTSIIDEQADIVVALDLKAEEQVIMITSLTSIVEEQAVILNRLNLKIEEQAVLINELSDNLMKKAQLVDLLQVENVKQAELIMEMKLSFADQVDIINQLDNTIQDDAVIIKNLGLNIEEQSNLINDLERTNEEKVQIINEMSLSLDEQKVLIDGLQATVEMKKALIGILELNLKEQNEIIDYLVESTNAKQKLIDKLNASLAVKESVNMVLAVFLGVLILLVLGLVGYIFVKK